MGNCLEGVRSQHSTLSSTGDWWRSRDSSSLFFDSFVSEFQLICAGRIVNQQNHKIFNNYELIKGDILQTVPKYLSEHPELKIDLLHMDVDVYQPTVTILNTFYDRVITGGLVVLDDFATVA